MVLSNYSTFVASRLRAQKEEQDLAITLAFWLWSIDQRHYLSSRNQQVRFNLLLSILKLSSPKPAANIGKAAVRFIRAFVNAWMLNSTREPITGNDDQRIQFITDTWRNDKYDLIFWHNHQRARIAKAVRKLSESVPPLPCPAADSWAFVQRQPKDMFEKHGGAWAMQYLLSLEREEQGALDTAKDEERTRSLEADTWMEDLDRSDVIEDGPPPYWLTKEHFQQPIVLALMTPVNEDVPKQENGKITYWMKPSGAANLLEGQLVGMDSLEKSLEKMSFLEQRQNVDIHMGEG